MLPIIEVKVLIIIMNYTVHTAVAQCSVINLHKNV